MNCDLESYDLGSPGTKKESYETTSNKRQAATFCRRTFWQMDKETSVKQQAATICKMF